MGLEALSNGAQSVDFVERDRRACDVIRRNLDVIDCADRARVLCVPVEAARALEPPYDLCFADVYQITIPIVRVHDHLVIADRARDETPALACSASPSPSGGPSLLPGSRSRRLCSRRCACTRCQCQCGPGSGSSCPWKHRCYIDVGIKRGIALASSLLSRSRSSLALIHNGTVRRLVAIV